jgi:hypothetical protein
MKIGATCGRQPAQFCFLATTRKKIIGLDLSAEAFEPYLR